MTKSIGAFTSRVTEISIDMDGLHITTVTKPEPERGEAPNDDEARIGDFHMSLFTASEWQELSMLIEQSIRDVTRN